MEYRKENPRYVPDPHSDARRLAYANDTRLKFDRVYESARKALARGDSETALIKCRAALDLLHQKTIYGPSQAALEQLLAAKIGELEFSGHHT